jgi:hypothetical protein
VNLLVLARQARAEAVLGAVLAVVCLVGVPFWVVGGRRSRSVKPKDLSERLTSLR